MVGSDGGVRSPGRVGWLAVALATAVLVLLAGRSDLDPSSHLTPPATAVDVGVGAAFVVGALVAFRGWRSRLPFLAVGWVWLVGSAVSLPNANLLYLPALAIALALFPLGRPTSRRDLVVLWLSLLAVVVLLPWLPAALAVLSPRTVMAALLTVVAATAWTGRRWERAAAWYPLIGGGAMAVVLGAGWLVETDLHPAYDPSVVPLLLDLVILGIAITLPVAAWAVRRERAQLADRLLADERGSGLDGLGLLLGDVLGDPTLRIERPARDAGARPTGGPMSSTAGPTGAAAGMVPVHDARGEPMAVIVHWRAQALEDPATRASVVDAVRLTAMHEREQAAQLAQLAELEAARGRLIGATDLQRAAISGRLREEVVPEIDAAAAELQAIGVPDRADEVGDLLEIARLELAASAEEVLAFTRGMPPVTLGDGRLAAALVALAVRSPVPASPNVAPDAIASEDAETALFYVCSEAIANAAKHAGADRITIDLRRDGEALLLRVADDGRGGADASGSGLRGLADRLDACGGRLRVESPPGAGTTLTAWVPAVPAS